MAEPRALALARLQSWLRAREDGSSARRDASLAALGRWRIGGPADLLAVVESRETLSQLLARCADCGLRWLVVGDGSNILFDDAGFRGVIIRLGREFCDFSAVGGLVTVGAAHWAPSFVRRTLSLGLGELVHAIGIPGTVGGLVVMNGGSQRKSVGDHLTRVQLIDAAGKEATYSSRELGLGYRRSVLQETPCVVVQATFELPSANIGELRREALAILGERRRKFPTVRENCGSVFVSDPRLYELIGPPGLAIERVGFKGMRRGGAQISPAHANFIVNLGGASSVDVLSLVAGARARVYEATGIAMVAEVRYLSPDGTLSPAQEAADNLNISG